MSEERKGCLAAVLNLFAGNGRSRSHSISSPEADAAQEILPYRRRDDFLSPAEASFYRVLKTAVGDQFLIFPRVGLEDLFFVAARENRRGHRSRIDRKHVDFVLCDPATLQPRVSIELDDASHRKAKQMKRDEFKDRVFAAAGLPLVRIPARRSYGTEQLRELLRPFLPAAVMSETAVAPEPKPSSPSAAGEPVAGPPACPKCGIPLVVRTVRNGRHAGKQFYGCRNYPQCTEMAPLVSASL